MHRIKHQSESAIIISLALCSWRPITSYFSTRSPHVHLWELQWKLKRTSPGLGVVRPNPPTPPTGWAWNTFAHHLMHSPPWAKPPLRTHPVHHWQDCRTLTLQPYDGERWQYIGVGTMGAMGAVAPTKFVLWRHLFWLHNAFTLGRFCPAPTRESIFLRPCNMSTENTSNGSEHKSGAALIGDIGATSEIAEVVPLICPKFTSNQ